ncbi:MAG: sel1 repeat family protein, partial [Pseudomonadales bacterium]|nr:sel1 repeat family protein [Pseudomonadales bacterium]
VDIITKESVRDGMMSRTNVLMVRFGFIENGIIAYKKEAEKQLMVHRVAKLNAETDRHSIDEFNDMAAKIRLANAYYEGSGVIQNYTLAARLFYDAAMRGHQLAQYNLGQMYFNGQGVTQDYVQAYAWWSVPKKHPRSLPRVLSKLNHEELVEAKALALQYRQMTQSR